MKVKFFSGIRWQMLRYFLLSFFLAVAGVILLVLFACALIGLKISFLSSALDLFFDSPAFLIFIFPAAALLFLGFFFWLSRGIIRDFEEISRSLALIAAGDLKHRVPVNGEDELGRLAENVNRMTARLESSITAERQARQTKDELVTSVSHDLRTPLTSILGYLDLIENDRYRDEVELRYYIQIVYAKAGRLKQMIEDLFEYTSLHGGSIRLNITPLNLGELLNQLVVEMQPLLDQAGVACRISPPEEKILVPADGDKLVRVFENLLVNAVQYGKEGRYVDLSWQREGRRAVVEVINYGAPIPGHDLPHIFERFYRLEKSRAEGFGGTGLGLAIAKNIVELHGGKITAYSDQQRTLFAVSLPAD